MECPIKDTLSSRLTEVTFFAKMCQKLCIFLVFSPSESEHSVQAYGIHADFSLGRHVYQEIDDALLGYEIGLLGDFTELECP